MPTNTVFRRRTWQPSLSDYEIAEAFHLRPPLIPSEGFLGKVPNGERGALNRDWEAIALAWQTHGDELIELWVSGWTPSVKFLDTAAKLPGAPGTRPAGWWRFCAPRPRRKRESESAYLSRLGLLLPGEAEAISAHTRRDATIKSLAGA